MRPSKREESWIGSLFSCGLSCEGGEDSSAISRREPTSEDVSIHDWLPEKFAPPSRDDEDEKYLWECVDEINELRCNPRRYGENKLKPLLESYPNKNRVEGVSALKEAIEALGEAKPCRALERHAGMDRAARDHAVDLESMESASHVGSDGSKPADRLSRYGQWYEAVAEIFSVGETSPADVVANLVICDGSKARRERSVLLNDDLRVCGIGSGGIDCVVLVAAVGYGPRPFPRPARVVTLEHDDFDLEDGSSSSSFTTRRQRKSRGDLGAAFEAILYSVPLRHVHDRVLAALNDGAVSVLLDYTPPTVAYSDDAMIDEQKSDGLGRVEVTITWPHDRSRPTVFTAQWR